MRVPVLQTRRDSFMHRRDPRVKVGLFILLIVFIYAAPSWVWMLGMALIGVLLALLSRAPVKWLAVLLLLQVPNIVGLIVIPTLGQLAEGQLVFDGRLQVGVKLALAWVAAILIGVSLISTMEIDELVEGMRGIGVPSALAFMVGYVFLLAYLGFNDILRIVDAMKLKGIELTWRRPLAFMRGLIRLAVPMTFTIVRRGTQMAAALDMRGFSAQQAKGRRARFKFDFADALSLAGAMVIVGSATAVKADLVQAPIAALEEPAQSQKQS